MITHQSRCMRDIGKIVSRIEVVAIVVGGGVLSENTKEEGRIYLSREFF